MSEFTVQEIAKLTEERALSNDQIEALQKAVREYHTKASK